MILQFRLPGKDLGFTLLELLIVLALIGIALGFSVASIDKLAVRIDERRSEDRTRQVLSGLRNRAVRTGVTIKALVVFNPAEIQQLEGKDSVSLLKLPDGFRYVSGSAQGSEGSQEKSVDLHFFADGAIDGLGFDLLSPQGKRYGYVLPRHTGQILGRAR